MRPSVAGPWEARPGACGAAAHGGLSDLWFGGNKEPSKAFRLERKGKLIESAFAV